MSTPAGPQDSAPEHAAAVREASDQVTLELLTAVATWYRDATERLSRDDMEGLQVLLPHRVKLLEMLRERRAQGWQMPLAEDVAELCDEIRLLEASFIELLDGKSEKARDELVQWRNTRKGVKAYASNR